MTLHFNYLSVHCSIQSSVHNKVNNCRQVSKNNPHLRGVLRDLSDRLFLGHSVLYDCLTIYFMKLCFSSLKRLNV